MSEQTSHPVVDFITSKIGITLLWIGNAIGAAVDHASQLALLLTILATLVNLYFTFRDKWWRDPWRKARRTRKRRS